VNQKKKSPLVVIVLALAITVLVMVLLNSAVRPTPAVVAKVAIAPGILLTADMLEVRSLPAGGVPDGAFQTIEELTGKQLAVGRAPGDFITGAVLGEAAAAGIPSQLAPGHVALAISVKQDSGLAGLLRPGQTITLIGMLTPDVLQETNLTTLAVSPAFSLPQPTDAGLPTATPTPTPTVAPARSPLARIAISGIRVLMVPQSFRYEEIPDSSEEAMFAAARTTNAAQQGSVIVLDVPTTPVEIVPGFWVNPVVLLAALNQYGGLYLALEPGDGVDLAPSDLLTLNLGELYTTLNAETAAGAAPTAVRVAAIATPVPATPEPISTVTP